MSYHYNNDYFDYWLELRFLKKYSENFTEFGAFIKKYNKNSEEDKEKAKKLIGYIENNSEKMRNLARNYAGVSGYSAHDWANAIYQEETHKMYNSWIRNSIITCTGYKNAAKSKILYHFIKRLFDMPFGVLEAAIGYDIRTQQNYRKYMTGIILLAVGLYLASQAKDLVEWGVALYKQIKP